MENDSLGDRMKGYENVTRARLVPRMPTLIRIDGKAFHTFTRHLAKPFDEGFQRAMWETARALCEEVQGCRFAYVQSDEISLLLIDYEELNTSAWFDGGLLKIVSVSASIATAAFARAFPGNEPAHFDSRAWNVPREEVANYFVWRQQDAVRNSIQGLAQAHLSRSTMHGLSCAKLQERLFAEHGINWNNLPTVQKRGACLVRVASEDQPSEPGARIKHEWRLDLEPPTFTQDRRYVERFVYPEPR